MALSDLISNVSQNGFWQGMQNYVGNDTNFGKTVNGLDNAYQQFTGQPKQQLIGQPASQTNPSMSSVPPIPDIKYMINAHATNQQAPQESNSQFNNPTQGPYTDESTPQQPSQNTSSSKGTGRDLVSTVALL